MTTNQGTNQGASQTQGTTQTPDGTTSITGSQITSGDSTIPASGNAAIMGAMGITGSITTDTPDAFAGGAPKTWGGTNPRT